MTDEPTNEERLDNHADHIQRILKELKKVRARLDALEPVLEVAPEPITTTYQPSTLCAMCGKDKGGRRTLTCAPCSAKRNRIIKNGGDRSEIHRTTCFSCGVGFKTSTRILCVPCSAGFKLWKASANR